MFATRKLLAVLAVSSGMMAFAASTQAGPSSNMTPLPELTPLTAEPLAEPVHCRRYYHCHTRCVRWRWGKCRRSVRTCHRC